MNSGETIKIFSKKMAGTLVSMLIVFVSFSPLSAVYAEDKPDATGDFPSNFCSTNLYSDGTEVINGGGNAVGTYNGHPDWTAYIYNADWIWSSYQVQNPEVEETVTFTRTFDLSSAPFSSSFLTMAADNSYVVEVNGTQVAANPGEFNYKQENVILMPITEYLKAGSNTITFKVTNFARPGNDWQINPAGLLYRVNIVQVGPCTSPVPPTVTLSANPSSINAGQNSALTWISTNATSCSAPWTVSTSTSGSQVVTPASTTVYSVTCVGPYGSASATTTIIVTTGGGGNPAPTVTLTANPGIMFVGSSTTLTWNSANATSCSSPYWPSTAISGEYVATPSTTTAFTVNCIGPGGSAAATTTVVVRPHDFPVDLPDVDLQANPKTITRGSSSTLTWTSINTTRCAVAWTSATTTSGSQIVSPSTTTDYVITCYGPRGEATAIAPIIVNEPTSNPSPTITLTANPSTINVGASSTLSWTSTNANNCAAGWTTSTSTSGSQVVTPATTTQYSISCTGPGGSITATTTVNVNTGGNGGGPSCTLDVVSDINTVVEGGSNAVATYKDHPYWTAVIPGATWIWKTFFVETPTQSETYVFVRNFNINNTVKNASLVVAADNTYEVFVNNLKIGGDNKEINFHDEQKDTYDLTNALNVGQNTIKFTVTNLGRENNTPQSNPAGLLYKLSVTQNGSDCNTQPTPSITLNANPSTINSGASSTLSWTSTNTNFCLAAWTTSNAVSGNQSVSPTQTTNYSISCGGQYGTTTATTTVNVNTGGGGGNPTPSITLTANPGSITSGASSTLSWISSNTSFCSASWTSATSTSGNQSVSPTQTTNYSMSCGGAYGTTTATTTVTVTTGGGGGGNPTPSINLSANPGTINNGGSSTLSWVSSNTSFCTAGWTSATSTSGSQTVNPTSTTDYSISCGGQYGTTTATTTVTVNQNNGGGGGGGGGIGGRRRDISDLLSPQGEILGATSCSYLRDYMRRDWQNDPVEVLKLQSFLNVFERENLSLTSVFDDATYDAVSRFQNKYFDDILRPWGHTAPTGFVYILTKKKVNEIYCNTSIVLSVEQQKEIEEFRSLLESLRQSGGIDDSSFGSLIGGTIGPSDGEGTGISTNVLDEKNVLNEGENVVVALGGEEKAASVLKNAAVSLFGLSKNLMSRDALLLGIAILLILIGFAIRRYLTKNEVTTVVSKAQPLTTISSPKKDSPVIILPGSRKQENELPEGEIVIENDEEILPETK